VYGQLAQSYILAFACKEKPWSVRPALLVTAVVVTVMVGSVTVSVPAALKQPEVTVVCRPPTRHIWYVAWEELVVYATFRVVSPALAAE